MPLWIVQRTSLPASTAGALLLLNTVIVIVLQTRVASEVGSAGAASRLLIRSSVVAVLGFAAMLLSAGRFPVAVEAIAIVVGLLLVTLCELLSSAAAWTCRFDFAVDGRQGEYGALFGLGESAVSWVAPGILGLVLQLWGGAVWLLLGAVYLGIAVASPATVSWCARTRPAREVSQPLRAG